MFGFSILIWIAVRAYGDAPPIPDKVVNAKGEIRFSGAEIRVGFWNFVGAGIFGFLINLHIVSCFEVGTRHWPLKGKAHSSLSTHGAFVISLLFSEPE